MPQGRSSERSRTRVVEATGGGVITRTTLPSGLRVVTEAMPAVRSVSVGVWVPVGSRHETPAVAGASHFLEHLLFKGTTTRSALEIATVMDGIGGELNAFTEKEHTCFYATVLDRDLRTAIDVVTDVVLNATVAAHDVDVERSVVLEEIAMRDDDPGDLVHDVFASTLFGDTALGRPILGTVDSVTGLRRAQIAGYYRRRYHVPDMVIAVAGNVEHRAVVALVRRALTRSGLVDGRPPRRVPAPRATAARATVVGEDTEQANIVLGTRGISRFDERRFTAGVLSAALGGGMSSRLFQRIREERGLAYSVYTFTGSYTDAGQFGVYAGCQPGKADEVLALIDTELAAVAGGGLTEAEVQRGKGQMCGGVVLGLEDSGSRMSRIGKSELVYGDILGVDDVIARIDAVSTDDVAELADDLLHRPRSLAVVGPFGPHEFDGVV